ncbi:MAG: magnesium protoporphyrin IX methyltransferase, partial [Okeania sp. SIO4D6]|nr:magnesium protoporphyrin IX methyltransferase [Okeania sp. SIO4D6]
SKAGAVIYGSDISEKMIAEAYQLAKSSLISMGNVNFVAQDLETLSGKYHTVICLDVLIHYPQEKVADMINHLISLAESRLIISFAPKTLALSLLKKVGELFPGQSKTTRAYQHREADIIKIIESNGFSIQRQAMNSTSFYYSRLLEATR